jgi:hypothetical protein
MFVSRLLKINRNRCIGLHVVYDYLRVPNLLSLYTSCACAIYQLASTVFTVHPKVSIIWQGACCCVLSCYLIQYLTFISEFQLFSLHFVSHISSTPSNHATIAFLSLSRQFCCTLSPSSTHRARRLSRNLILASELNKQTTKMNHLIERVTKTLKKKTKGQ